VRERKELRGKEKAGSRLPRREDPCELQGRVATRYGREADTPSTQKKKKKKGFNEARRGVRVQKDKEKRLS